MSERTCREAVLEVAHRLEASGQSVFTIPDVLERLRGSEFAGSTIRTHIASRMCVDAPDHHQSVSADLERVGRGQYRLRRS